MTNEETIMHDATYTAFNAAECIEAARRGNVGMAFARADDMVVSAADTLSRIARLAASPPTVAMTDARLLALKLGLVLTELQEASDAAFRGDVTGVEEELADAIIRLLHIAAGLNMDMEETIIAKMRHNAARPHRHGKITGA